MSNKPFPTGRVCLDYETTSLQPYEGGRPFVVGLEDEAGNVKKLSPQDPVVKRLIEDPRIEKICHGSKFELKHSYHLGFNPKGKFHDTMCKAVLVNEYQKINLDDLSKKWLNDDSKGIVQEWLKANAGRIRRETGREPNYSDVPTELLHTYLEGDLDKTLKLDWLWRGVEADPKLGKLYGMETDLAWELAEMEDVGFRIDLPYVRQKIGELEPESDRIERELWDMAGVRFNPAAPRQLSEVLEGLEIDTGEKNKDGSMRTRFELLAALDPHPFIDKLVRWRGIRKIVGTYLKPFTQKAVGDDTVHGTLWQFGQDDAIVTGRLSSSDPNLQNMPGGGRSTNKVLQELGPIVRRAIIPPKGHALVFFDYKQIEMVIFTDYSGEQQTIDDIKRGVDIYVAHGKMLLGETAFDGVDKDEFKRRRFKAKEMCLSLIYGQGLSSFAKKAKISMLEARKRRDAYFTRSPRTRQFMIQLSAKLLQNGFVEDVFGRRYHVPRELSYKATNGVCQGSAATIMKQGILSARPLKALGFRPMFPVHDELIGICPINNVKEVIEAGKELLADRKSFRLPIEVEAAWSDKSWADKKEWKS